VGAPGSSSSSGLSARPKREASADNTDPDSGPPLEIGLGPNGEVESIGRYHVRGVLGRGGMGVVYEVEAEGDSARYALKTIETRFLELTDNAAAQRFGHEIKVLERLVHPGIVRLYDAGIARHPLGYDLAYYVMEKLEGDTLVTGIKSGTPYPVDDALRVVAGLGEALDYLAKSAVLHRDIKPGNIFLEDSGRIVLVDFGLARSQEFTRLTLAGQIVGTFSYMSPERLAGAPVDVAADVFAVGVVFFQMLTGRHPFGAGTPPELMAAIHRGIDWPESFSRLEKSAGLKELLTAMLAIDARDRPSPTLLAERVRAMRSTKKPVAFTRSPQATMATLLIEPDRTKLTPPPANVRPIAATDPTPARSHDRTPLPPPRRPEGRGAMAPGPPWAIFVLVSASIACLAFTIGLLVGSHVQRPMAPPPATTATTLAP